MLAQQAGAALTNAALHRLELGTAIELRRVNDDLAVVNEQLNATVADLECRGRRLARTTCWYGHAGPGDHSSTGTVNASTSPYTRTTTAAPARPTTIRLNGRRPT